MHADTRLEKYYARYGAITEVVIDHSGQSYKQRQYLNFGLAPRSMDPISLSLAIAPLIFSSAKLLATVGSIRHEYKSAQTTVTSTQTECKLMHIALYEVHRLVHRNRMELAVRLRSQKSLEETFDNVLTGCRITLDALALELDDLLKPIKGRTSGSGDMNHQTKFQYIWKKDAMEELTGQMRNQRDYIQFLVTILCRSVPQHQRAG